MTPEDEAAERRLERFKRRQAHLLEMVKATVAAEHAALRPPFLLNGGALVVYLALYGGVRQEHGASLLDPTWAKVSMSVWIVGLLAATLATAFGYYSQFAFRRHRDQESDAEEQRELNNLEEAGRLRCESDRNADRGNSRRRVAEITILFSLAAFITGVVTAMVSLPTSSGPVSDWLPIRLT